MTTAAPVPLGAVESLPIGGALRVDAAVTGTGDAIAVFRTEKGLFALDDTCTHGQASLAEGWVEDGVVECPLHSGQFCLRTGEPRALPVVRGVRVHRVTVEDGEAVLHPGVPAG